MRTSNKLMEEALQHLRIGEMSELRIAGGSRVENERGKGLVSTVMVATPSRVLICTSATGGCDVLSVPYEKIVSASSAESAFGGRLTLYFGGSKFSLEKIDEAGSPTSFATLLKGRLGPLSPGIDPVEKLERLGALLNAGHLTATEFQAAKSAVLSRM